MEGNIFIPHNPHNNPNRSIVVLLKLYLLHKVSVREDGSHVFPCQYKARHDSFNGRSVSNVKKYDSWASFVY